MKRSIVCLVALALVAACRNNECPTPPSDAGVLCAPNTPCETVTATPDSGCVRAPIAGCSVCLSDNGKNGTRRTPDGACCTGCWAGAECLAGTAVEACGALGANCESCNVYATPACGPSGCIR